MSDERSWIDKVTHWFDRIPENTRDLIELLHEIKKEGVLDAESLAMIEGVLQVSELTVAQIMIPRAQMVSVIEAEKPSVFIQRIYESGHSRFPVFDDRREQVKGIFLAKDLLQLILDKTESAHFDFIEYLRPAMIIPETKRLDSLLQEFRRGHQHMAIAVDEYGTVVGLVTIEDVLEQIVGEIDDEYDTDDDEEHHFKQQPNGTVVIKATLPLDAFNAHFGTDYRQGKASTIGGFLLNHWHHLPRRNESLRLNGLVFTVLKADHRRIHLLSVKAE